MDKHLINKTYLILLPFIKNKYLIVGVFFILWMLFFDENTFIAQFKMHNKITNLLEQKQATKNQIDKIKSSIYDLNTNTQTLEKYAREEYLMKKDNEDVFILVPKK